MAKKKSERRHKEVRKRYPVTPAEFVATCNTSKTYDEVAAKLGMPKPIVMARVSFYRRKGIAIKKMRRAETQINPQKLQEEVVELLNNMIDMTAEVEAEYEQSGVDLSKVPLQVLAKEVRARVRDMKK